MPANYSTSTDARALAIRFLELRAFMGEAKEEVLFHRFYEPGAEGAIDHLYGLGETEEFGVWIADIKSAFVIHTPKSTKI